MISMAIEGAVLGALSDRTTGLGTDPESDTNLVRQLIEGSPEALASLYDRHAQTVFAAAMRTSRDRWIAEEVVQETFLTLWNRAERYDPSRGALRAWLLTIARNRAVDRLRAAGRHDRAAAFSSFGNGEADDQSIVEWLTASGELIVMAGPEPGPEVALSSKETRASIQDALASLAPLERQVIVLAYDDGLSQSEIAAHLGWPVGTVKTRTRRALGRLREMLAGWDEGVSARPAAAQQARARRASTQRPRSKPTPVVDDDAGAVGEPERRTWSAIAAAANAFPCAYPCP
jgi:RNA polymerase sigma-70 factor (ECF subfamily)